MPTKPKLSEDELVIRKMKQIEREHKRKGIPLETLEDVLRKYPYLKVSIKRQDKENRMKK